MNTNEMEVSIIKTPEVFELTAIERMMRDAESIYKFCGYELPAQHIIARYVFYDLFGDDGQGTLCN